jgi:hypothetical protein
MASWQLALHLALSRLARIAESGLERTPSAPADRGFARTATIRAPSGVKWKNEGSGHTQWEEDGALVGLAMSRRRLVASVVGLLALVLAALIIWRLHQTTNEREAQIESDVSSGPLTISVSEVRGFSRGFSWKLLVDPTGKAILKIDAVPTPKHRQFVVPQRELNEFRAVLARERFFELDDSYGDPVVDSSTTRITISAGKSTKTVELLFLMNWVQSDPGKLRESSRALRVLQMILGWFNDPEAVDLRKYNRMVLDAATRRERKQ